MKNGLVCNIWYGYWYLIPESMLKRHEFSTIHINTRISWNRPDISWWQSIYYIMTNTDQISDLGFILGLSTIFMWNLNTFAKYETLRIMKIICNIWEKKYISLYRPNTLQFMVIKDLEYNIHVDAWPCQRVT